MNRKFVSLPPNDSAAKDAPQFVGGANGSVFVLKKDGTLEPVGDEGIVDHTETAILDVPEDALPKMREMMMNAGGALKAAAVSGFKTVSKEERKNRLDICEECDKYKNGRCLECGCFLSFKTTLEAWHCPIKKW